MKDKIKKIIEGHRIYAQYEYRCPYCKRVNTRWYRFYRIVCDYCKKEFDCW